MQVLRYDTAYVGNTPDYMVRIVPDGPRWSAALLQKQSNILKVWANVGTEYTQDDDSIGTIRKLVQSNGLPQGYFTVSEVAQTEYDDFIINQARKIRTQGEVIYFVSVNGMNRVKIGTTTCMINRYITFRSTIPFSLNILAVAQIGCKQERSIQKLFSRDSIGHEWFNLSPEIQSFISDLGAKQVPFPVVSTN